MSESHEKPGIWKKRWPAWLLGVIVVVVFVLAISPVLLRQRRMAEFVKSSQNAKSVGYALFNFAHDHGCYPNDRTGKQLVEELEAYEDSFLGATGGSNYYFSQVIASGYVDQESPFFAHTGNTVHPDNDKSSPEKLLQSGEVGFVYVVWESIDDLPGDAPLMFAFLDKDKKATGQVSAVFLPQPKAIVLRHNMSVDHLSGERDGTIMVNGKDFFDWSQPHWGGQKPKIVWPE